MKPTTTNGFYFPFFLLITVTYFSTASIAADQSPVRGVIKSANEATLSATLNARVEELPVKTGESFKKGDILVSFDCNVLNTEQMAAEAAFNAAQIRHQNNLELLSYGAVGDLEVKISAAEKEEAEARHLSATYRTDDCVIKAPYNGKVAELLINTHETPRPDQSLMKIVGSDALELKLIVPSNWLSWLEINHNFVFEIDETDSRHKAIVSQIGGEVDAVSKTVVIIARFLSESRDILPGMSGTALFFDES